MRKFMFVFVLLVGCVSFEPTVNTIYDEYTGTKSSAATCKFSPDGLNLFTVKFIKGQNVRMITLYADLNRWYFIEKMYVLADDDRYAKAAAIRPKRQIMYRRVFETVSFAFTDDEFRKVIMSSNCKIKFVGKNGVQECVLNEKEIAKIKELDKL